MAVSENSIIVLCITDITCSIEFKIAISHFQTNIGHFWTLVEIFGIFLAMKSNDRELAKHF